MASPHPGSPQQGTGLPPGVTVGPLGARFVAYLIDSVVPGVLGAVLGLVAPGLAGTGRVILTVVLVGLILGWVLLVWRMIAVRAASPGMRAMKLQVVGFYDGRPLGWGRTFVRGLLLALLAATAIGLLIMVVLLVLHPRRQGWHDLAAKAVMIKARQLAPTSPHPVSAGTADPQSGSEPVADGEYPSQTHEVHGVPQVSYEEAGTSSRSAGEPAQPGDWVAELDDGRQVVVERLVLLGRNPQPQPGEEDAQLIKLADETRTVSKSHLAIGLDAAGLYVVDRGSTNGSTVTDPAGSSVRVQPGEIVYVEQGSIVSLGDHWLRLHRAPSEPAAASGPE